MKTIRTLLLVMLYLSLGHIYASHISGGDISYQATGANTYKITLNLYRDCNGRSLPDSATVDYSSAICGVTSSLTLHQDSPIVNVTDTCPGHLSACNGGTGYGIERHTYTGTITLPAGCGADWVISYRNCARNAAITNIVNPGTTCFYIKATLDNTVANLNHSPIFDRFNPPAFICVGQASAFNQSCTDPDGDSLVYALVAPESAAGTAVVYAAGYSATAPITGTLSLDHATGQITSLPTISQVAVFKILVTKYRSGLSVGTVERDIQVVTQLCNDSVPILSNITATTLPHSGNTVIISPCANGCFKIVATTPNTDTTVHLTTIWNGLSVPGATFSTTTGHSDTVTICWTPTRANAGTHQIYLTVKDNACPNPGSSTQIYNIVVPMTYPAGPDRTVNIGDTAHMAATGTGNWSALPTNPSTTVFSNTSSGTTGISGFGLPGIYSYIWTGGGCTDTASVIVHSIIPANCVLIPDTNFGTWLDTSGFAGCVTGNNSTGWYLDTTCSTVLSDTFFNCPSSNIHDLTGIAYFKNIQWLYCVSNHLTSLPALPARLRYLHCTYNQITSISNLPDSLIYLDCSQNQIRNIVSLPSSLVDLYCWFNALDSLPTLPASLTSLYCYWNNLTWLPTLPSALTFLDCNQNQIDSLPALPSRLIALLCSYNQLTRLPVIPSGLNDLECSSNFLTYLPPLPASISTLKCDNNSSLSCVPPILNISLQNFRMAGTNIQCLSNHFTARSYDIRPDTLPICGVGNMNGCNVYFSAGPDQTICSGSIATMAATGTGWWLASSVNTAVVTFDHDSLPTTTVSGFINTGIYQLIYTNGVMSDTMNVTIHAKPIADFSSQMLCPRDTIQFTDHASCTDPIISWFYDFADSTLTTDTSRVTNPRYAYLSATAHNAQQIVTTIYGCSDSFYLPVFSFPAIAAHSGGNQTYCLPHGAVTLGGSPTVTGGSGPYSYSWSPSTNLSSTSTSNPVISTAVAGTITYYVTATNISSGCTSIDSMVLSISPQPTVSLTASSLYLCAGGTDTLTAYVSPSGGNYTWAPGGQTTASIIVSPAITTTETVSYIVAGCSVTDSVVITVSSCASDSVWPGDADNNRLVDNNDLLPIGLAYSSRGPVRPVQGIVWQADQASDWVDTIAGYSPRLNDKFADCNGDGIVDANDTLAIVTNFSLTHFKTNAHNSAWRSGAPVMSVQLSHDTVIQGDTLSVSVLLGDAQTPIQQIYGVAFTLHYDPIVFDSTTSAFDFDWSWFGNSSNAIALDKDDKTTGTVKAAITGINHVNRSGYGLLAVLKGTITTGNINGKNLRYHTSQYYISDIKAVDILGQPVIINEGSDSNKVGYVPTGIADIAATARISIHPNPAKDKVLITADAAITEISISDVLGKEVIAHKPSGRLSETIDLSALTQGMYIVRVSTVNGSATAKLVLSK